MVATNRRQIAEIVAGIVFAIFVVGNSWAQGSVHNEKILAAIEPFENIAETALKGDAKAAAKAFTIASVVHIWQEGDITIYSQESNYTTWRLAKKNLASRGIDGQIAQGDTFHNDRFPDLKADFILANPPFNMKEWGGERLREDKRWKYGVPPAWNPELVFVQHMIYCLVPTKCGVILRVSGA